MLRWASLHIHMLVGKRPERALRRASCSRAKAAEQALLESRSVPATAHWLPFSFTLVWNLSGTTILHQTISAHICRTDVHVRVVGVFKSNSAFKFYETEWRLWGISVKHWLRFGRNRFHPARVRIRMFPLVSATRIYADVVLTLWFQRR